MGYQNSETSEPIVPKFGMGDYVGDMTPHSKIQSDRLPHPGKWVKYYSRMVFIFFLVFVTQINFFSRVPRLNRKSDFHAV